MKIGIDIRTILDEAGEGAGIGHYTWHLVKNLLKQKSESDQFVLFLGAKQKIPDFVKNDAEIVRFVKARAPLFSSHLFDAETIKKAKVDVFHSPASALPLFYGGKSVLTIHDLAIYDHPEWFPPRQSFSTNIVVPKSLRKALKIIAVSQHTKKELQNIFHLPEIKIKVVYNGVDTEKIELPKASEVFQKYKIVSPYILFVGTIEPRKNLGNLLKAFDSLSGSYPELSLVLAGKYGWRTKEIDELLAKVKKVIVCGYVSESEKRVLLQNCAMFIFPSWQEGFGLPVLEAFREGSPVITSNTTSLPEVAGEAAIMINPGEFQEIAKAMRTLYADKNLQNELSEKGKLQARKFSWEKCATETYQVYKSI